MRCEEAARVLCLMVAARRVRPCRLLAFPLLGVARDLHPACGVDGARRAERAERHSHCVAACVWLGRRTNKAAASFTLPRVVLDRRRRDRGPASVLQSPFLQDTQTQHFCPLSPRAWPACQCHLLKLFLIIGHCVSIPASPSAGGPLLTRRLLTRACSGYWGHRGWGWETLRTSANAVGKVHGLRVPRVNARSVLGGVLPRGVKVRSC